MKNSIMYWLLVCFFCTCNLLVDGQSRIKSKILSGKVNANGITLAYEILGPSKGEAILLINGVGSQLTDWPIELCEKLSKKGYRVIRFDNRDSGLSSKLDSLGAPNWGSVFTHIKTCEMSSLPYSIEDMAKDAVSLLDALKIKKAHIVGVSMGGALAQTIAINFPNRTLSLTSIAASSGNPNLPTGDPQVLAIMGTPPPQTKNIEEISKYLFNIYKVMGGKNNPVADTILINIARKNVNRSWYPAGTERQVAAILLGDNCDRREKLKTIKVPTVVIHGEDDPVVNVAAAKDIAENITGAKLIIIPDMGHALPSPFIDQIAKGILMVTRKN